ncbi:hypothetical protein MNEG_14380 [Monoraphidium neglectum]|uniref:Uncharacterized protein n=1 Tax=Monoraphidium neglectum TaxID=145388 RepID=A0A0D2LPA4_9CHLO|nr:hypothetical protein MNEG_14380 [Monoraphidium neglectum]KIY93584.1 hypothetical protein MNEG_14380 [Monoraphidium neglectum]|eukprot:XP_013892604.1 hypothetical protein MNEG_14380 [Monoraphidium neglectum]
MVELGFESLAAAREWHALIQAQLQAQAAGQRNGTGDGGEAVGNGGAREGPWRGMVSPEGDDAVSAVASPDSSLPLRVRPLAALAALAAAGAVAVTRGF